MLPLFRTAVSALICFALSLGPVQAAGAPALWLVQGAKAKVYLFGTIHVLKPGVDWVTPAIDSALAASDDLWLEVPENLNDVSAILPQVQELGMDPAHPLSTKISKDDLARVDTLVKAAGLPGEAAIEPFRPWFAAMMVTMLPLMKAGYTQKAGVEETLRAKIAAAGKPIKGFETVGEQLHFFADLPPDKEIAFFHQTLSSAGKDDTAAGPEIDKLESFWQSGDAERAAAYEKKFGEMDPSLTATLVTGRNAAWAKRLDERLHGEGTSFVAVGLLHLVGTGSLIDDLTKLGYTVTRVE